MKNRFTKLLIAFVLFAFASNGQTVYNSGFEQLNSDGTIRNWGNVYLESFWIDSSGVSHTDSIVRDGPYFAPTLDAHNGTFAMELRNAWNYSSNRGISGAAGVDDDSIFSAYGLMNLLPTYATPFNPFQPINFGFYYKFTQVNGDTAYALITLGDSSGNEVGSALILITDPTSTFTHIYAPINYVSSGNADFYLLNIGTFYSVEPGSHDPSLGTRLIVDDIGFNFVSPTGVNDIDRNALTVFPNPTSEFVILNSPPELINSVYDILDISGRIISTGKISTEQMKISLERFEYGIYFLKTQTTEVKIILVDFNK